MKCSIGSVLVCLLAGVSFSSSVLADDAPAAGAYDLQIVAHQTPPSVEQWSSVTVPLVLRNDGTTPWTPEQFNVAYHWRTPGGEPVVWDGERTPFPATVLPGAEVSMDARLVAPKVSGTFHLQWDVVHESLTWVSERDPTPPGPIAVSITPGILIRGFTIQKLKAPRLMWAGQRREVGMRLRNDGSETWTPDGIINVSYHWKHPDAQKGVFDGTRTSLPEPVVQGDEVELVADLRAPDAAGIYRLQWDMVHENVAWFSERDPTAPPELRVLVLPNPFHGPRGSFVIGLILLGLTIYAVFSLAAPRWTVAVASIADLLWLASALVLKQAVVLDEIEAIPLDGSFAIITSGVAVVVITVALMPRTVRPWVAIVTNGILSLLILADVIYLRFFGDVLSLTVIGASGQTGQILESIGSLLSPGDLWLALDILPGAAIAVLVMHLRARTGRRPVQWLAIILLPLLIPGAIAVWRISDATHGKFVQVFRNIFIVQELGILNYHVFDAVMEIDASLSREPLPAERTEEIESWFRATASRRAGTGPWFGAGRGSDLVMLQVESLQSFVIGLEIEGQEITPTLNRWRDAPEVWSADCVDQTAQGRTSDGEFVTQTSLLPARSGAVAFRFGANRYEAIGDILAAHGYHTVSAVPFEGAFWNRLVTHPEYGYRTNLFEDEFDPGPRVGWGLNDRDFLMQMASRLDATRSPYAAFLLTLSNHHPYAGFPDELKELDLGAWEGTSLGNYLHSVHFFDAAFARFLAELDDRGRLERTVIALWGDHTAGFPWDAKIAGVMGLNPIEKNFYIAERVPLFIRVPGTVAPVATPRCGQFDVAPTLLSILGVDPARYPFLGRNLFGAPAGPVVRSYNAWLDDELLYFGKGSKLEEGRCYELATMDQLPVERCRDGHAEASEQREISREIIRHDLHQPLTEALHDPERR